MRKKSSTFGPSLRASRGDPERRLTAWVPPCSRSVQRKSGTARGKASASLAKQLERIARSGVSHIAMDTQNVIRRWCGARYGCGLANASRGRTLFDGGAGFAGLRGRPSPSPTGRSGPSPAEGPRRSRQGRSGPAGAASESKTGCLREGEGRPTGGGGRAPIRPEENCATALYFLMEWCVKSPRTDGVADDRTRWPCALCRPW